MNFELQLAPRGQLGLTNALAEIVRAQLARRTDDPELEYVFKHALTQDAAYSTLMKQERKRLHQLVAETLEQAYAGGLDEIASRLAQQYAEAGNAAKTFQYGVRAGIAAAKRSANVEARANYDMALDALLQLPDTPQTRRDRVDTLLGRVGISLRSEGPRRSLERLAEAESLARSLTDHTAERQDRLRLARVQFWIGQASLHAGATLEAIRNLEQVLTIAGADGEDTELRALASSIIGRALVTQGLVTRARPYLEYATAHLDMFATNHEWVMAVGGLGFARAVLGEYKEGAAEGLRALDGAMQVNTLTSTALANMWLCLIYQMGNDIPRLNAASALVLEMASKAGEALLLFVGYGFKAYAQSRAGNHQSAFELWSKSEQIRKQLGGRLILSDWLSASAAEIELNAGRLDAAVGQSAETVRIARENGIGIAVGRAERIWGRSLATQGAGPDRVEPHFISSANYFDESDARIESARTQLAWGRFLLENGKADQALKHLNGAAAQFKASGLDQELAETQELSSTV